MRKIHIANSKQRNSIVLGLPVKSSVKIIKGYDGQTPEFRRYIAVGEGKSHEELSAKFGDDYSKQLVESDEEIDIEIVGKFIENTQGVYLTSDGTPLFAAPQIVEITLNAEGEEVKRSDPKEVSPTVTEQIPLRWTGKKIPKSEAVKKYLIKRTIQITHSDGVTFDFLKNMAEELSQDDSLVLLAAGSEGKDPIILSLNGSPYRGFLEGRVEGDKYLLLLHLSNMEIKKPLVSKKSGDEDE